MSGDDESSIYMPNGYAFHMVSLYAPDGVLPRRTWLQRYVWRLRHPVRAWRTRGCGL